MLIDTHCHLGDPAFDADRPAVVERMRAAGVRRVLVVESRRAEFAATVAWAATDPTIGVATGCHPHDASGWNADLRQHLVSAWQHPGVVAAGEIGLDYHYDHAPRDVQQRAFSEQLALAVAARLPVVVHAREADGDTAAILREQPGARIVLHSFSSGPRLRDAGLADGWYFSFSGMVTFASWTQQDTVRAIPSERLLIETDAPYLAPVPHRGRRNEPAFVAQVARKVAELRGVSFDDIAVITSRNASQLFWNSPAQ